MIGICSFFCADFSSASDHSGMAIFHEGAVSSFFFHQHQRKQIKQKSICILFGNRTWPFRAKIYSAAH